MLASKAMEGREGGREGGATLLLRPTFSNQLMHPFALPPSLPPSLLPRAPHPGLQPSGPRAGRGGGPLACVYLSLEYLSEVRKEGGREGGKKWKKRC